MSNQLQRLKGEFDEYLSKKPVFTEEDKLNIRKGIRSANAPSSFSRTLIPKLLAFGVLFFSLYLGNYLITNTGNLSQPTPLPTSEEIQPLSGGRSVTVNEGQPFSNLEGDFLTDTEIAIYQQFAATRNDDLLRGLQPLFVFKLFYYAFNQKDYETQYALLTNDLQSSTSLPTVSEFIFFMHSENRWLEVLYRIESELIGDYAIGEQLINEAYAVVFIYPDISIHLSKDDNGIWKVNWPLLQ